MSPKYLIRGGCVLTLGDRTPNFAEADVIIEDGRVSEIGHGLRARNAEVIDATDTIVMPGFVDTHRHAWRSLFRNFGEAVAPGTPPVSPLTYGPHYQPEDVYAGTLIGLLGAVESGITTVIDWADVGLGEEFRSAALQAQIDSGLRTVFVHASPAWDSTVENGPSTLRSLVETTASSQTISIAAGLDRQSGLTDDTQHAGWKMARDLNLRIHTHVGMDPIQRGSVAALGKDGLLSDDVTLIHCSHLDDADLDAIASSRAGVALTPSSEMTGGLGAPPIQQLLDRGIRPGLGVDDERVAPGDMFAQMRATNSIQHATMFDLKLAGKAGVPTMLSTREVIKYATIDGAHAVGLHDLTGSLEVGKQADLIILRADRPNIAPINDPIGAVVWGMDSSNVDWVFVGGRPIMASGELQLEVSSIRARALQSQSEVAGASGLAAVSGSSE